MFGGGGGDNGAAAMAEANRQAAREAEAAAQARWEREQERIKQDKLNEQQMLAQQDAKRQQELEYQRQEAARQADAQAKTGSPTSTFQDSRSDKAKLYAAASAGLPGFDNLKKRAAVQTPQAATGPFGGTGNSPTGGFNMQQVGGRRYVA